MKAKLILLAALVPGLAMAASVEGRMGMHNISVNRAGSNLDVSLDIVLDSLKMKGKQQLYVTPVVTDNNGQSVVMPAVLVNGRNMHIAYQRGTIRDQIKRHDIVTEIERRNGSEQSVHYTGTVPFEKWMLGRNAGVRLDIDTCGCGVDLGRGDGPFIPIDLMPEMRLVYITPKVTDLPETVHEGKARVQFEVDKTELHAEPYTCRSGQKIDNRAELRTIDDSVHYALTNPNVEISRIEVTGYASPESPYTHNDYLATNRSKALADYLAAKYSLPSDRSAYGAVPENWGEFREQVLKSTELTDQQRRDLLELIDRPVYGPADYDAKEKELKTSPKFAKLYKSTILPKWFPRLRATKFAIRTRLKPMSDQQLAEIIKTNPELMNLNMMFRVARLYPEGSKEFNDVIAIAHKFNKDNPEANLNLAIAKMSANPDAEVLDLLNKAGDSPEANNARGAYWVRRADFDKAAEYFRLAGSLPEAAKNLNSIDKKF